MPITTKQWPTASLPSPVTQIADNAGDTHTITLKDSTITSETDAGYKQTRPRNTRIIETYSYSWTCLTDDQVKTVRDFFESVGTFDAFIFTDYSFGNKHAVRFADTPTLVYIHPVGWNVSLKFEEV